jgi:uncharacterized protein (DUF362 family)/NAD-dependent dihydropyrimidine dehydrogenase PreA subunit
LRQHILLRTMRSETGASRPAVSIVRCRTYQPADVQDSVRRAVVLLGGISKYVGEGERVLIKPNMLAARHPDKAVTTHPEVLRAVIRLVKEAGGDPVVGDSPAGPSTERILKHLANRTGISAVCEQEGVEFALFLEPVSVAYENGRVAKRFDLTKTLDEVDAVVSLAKLKTHSFTRFTGAVKNLFGLVHGLKKAEYHLRMNDPEAFSEMLVDLAGCVRPRLTIMDAVVGMDGDGPSAGRPRDIGLLLASSDVHALDVAAITMVGGEPDDVWTVRAATERGLLPREGIDGIDVLGEPMESVMMDDFRMPPKLKRLGAAPSFLANIIAEGMARKPVFDDGRCVSCGRCVEICPAEALELGGRERRKVRIARELCIRCYCCHEICPETAITLKRMPARSWGRAIGRRLKGTNSGKRSARSDVKE